MPKPSRVVICQRCQRERPHHCKEMCKSCYAYVRRLLKVGICIQCGRERKDINGAGFCNSCNVRAWQVKQGSTHLIQHAQSERFRRERMGEIYREQDRERNKRRRNYRLAYNQAYYHRNAKRMRQYQSEYRKTHPEWVAEVKRRRRTRKYNLPATLTMNEWDQILEQYNHSCAYCGVSNVPLIREHNIPVTKGGGYTAENIVPACVSCNARKHDKTGAEYLAILTASSPS